MARRFDVSKLLNDLSLRLIGQLTLSRDLVADTPFAAATTLLMKTTAHRLANPLRLPQTFTNRTSSQVKRAHKLFDQELSAVVARRRERAQRKRMH